MRIAANAYGSNVFMEANDFPLKSWASPLHLGK